jgi:hypothetical protein
MACSVGNGTTSRPEAYRCIFSQLGTTTGFQIRTVTGFPTDR